MFSSHNFRHNHHQPMTKAGPALRSEVDGVWYLESHQEVAEFFRQTGVFSYCEKLTRFHQQVAESFALSYDGRTAKVGKEEIIIDEATIVEYTGLPEWETVGLKPPHLQTASSGPICY
jgi:hypothetical protein